jgi:hypothetical protein
MAPMTAISSPLQEREASEKIQSSEPDKIESFVDGSATSSEHVGISNKTRDAFLGSNQQHVFSTAPALAYWSDVYEKAVYEGRHRFDPLLQWSPSEEKRLIRKVAPALKIL